jgi:CIC family chloride channel protein
MLNGCFEISRFPLWLGTDVTDSSIHRMKNRIWLLRAPDLWEGASFLRKWGLIGVLIGIGAGLGALALIWCIGAVTRGVLGPIAGYTPPLPGGEGGAGTYVFHVARPWLLPFVTGAIGLIGGFLTWKFAPETAGIGTNAAIGAFHRGAKIPFPTAIFKLVTSALTIGGGLTSGREGPIAQIGAATGSSIADVLKLTAHERNMALAAGLGAGIAAIFKAPLAGALIAAEIFYMEDFEVEALVPGVIASVIGYSIVGAVTGFQPVFSLPTGITEFRHPLSLILFVILGVGCAVLARALVGVFTYVERLFRRFPLWAAAAIGGMCTGLIGMVAPSVIGTGYGWAQFAIDQNVHLISPTMMLLAAIAEIVASSLTLGSGNSGGMFGPCVVTGGMFGGAFGCAVGSLFPALEPHAGDYAIVGMMAFFAAAAKAPVSTIIMISEMTGGYGLLAPAMFAVVTAFILSGKKTIFPAQVNTRLDSPFHADEFEPIALRRVKVADVMIHLPVCVNAQASVAEAVALMGDYGLASLPVVEHNRLCGRVTLLASNRVPESQRLSTNVKGIMSLEWQAAFPNEDLFTILKRFAANDVGNLPIVTPEQPERPIGLITRSGLWSALEAAKQRGR